MSQEKGVRYVVKRGDEYADFRLKGDQETGTVGSVTWIAGETGKRQSTKFKTRASAARIAGQIKKENVEVVAVPHLSPNIRYLIGTTGSGKQYWLCKIRREFVWRHGPSGRRMAHRFPSEDEARQVLESGFDGTHGKPADVIKEGWE